MVLQSLEFLTAMEVVSQGGFPSLAHVDRDFNEYVVIFFTYSHKKLILLLRV